MNFLWFSQSLSEVVGWTLVHSFWQFLILAGIYWMLLRFRWVRSASSRYLAALLTLALMAGTFFATLGYELGPIAPPGDASFGPWQAFPEAVIGAQGSWLLDKRMLATLFLDRTLPYLVHVWLVGVLFYMLRLFGNITSLSQLKQRSSVDIPEWMLQKGRLLVQRMGIRIPVSIRVSTEANIPLTFGCMKPIVLFPVALIGGLPPAQVEALLAHELAHIRRYDYLINIGQSFLETIFFYHPAFWWVTNSVREAREQIADDLAIGAGAKPADLALALAYVANQAGEPVPELAMAAQKSAFPTLLRIQRILGKQSVSRLPTPAGSKFLAAFGVLGVILSLGMAPQQVLDPSPESRASSEQLPTVETPPTVLPRLPAGQTPPQPAPPLPKTGIDLVGRPQVAADMPKMPALLPPSPLPVRLNPIYSDSIPGYSAEFLERLGDSLRRYGSKRMQLHPDSTPAGLSHAASFEHSMRALQQIMATSQRAFEHRIKKLEEEFKPRIAEYEAWMEAWRRQSEPTIQEFEARVEAWGRMQHQKMHEMEEKMRKKEEEISERMKKREAERQLR